MHTIILITRMKLVVRWTRATTRSGSDNSLDIGVFMAMGITKLGVNITLGAKVEEEDDHERSEDDCGTPGVVSPMAGHANTGSRADLLIGRVEEAVDVRIGRRGDGQWEKRRLTG